MMPTQKEFASMINAFKQHSTPFNENTIIYVDGQLIEIEKPSVAQTYAAMMNAFAIKRKNERIPTVKRKSK